MIFFNFRGCRVQAAKVAGIGGEGTTYTCSIYIVHLDGPTDPIFRQFKNGIFADRNCCLHFVINEIRATKFELFDDIIFRKLKEFNN